MLIRLVRMTFQPEKTPEFLAVFRESEPLIRTFDGCLHLELLQDADQPAVYATLSHWRDTAALEAYRQSPLFRQTWARTKVLFADKPQAVSYQQVAAHNR